MAVAWMQLRLPIHRTGFATRQSLVGPVAEWISNFGRN